MKKNTSVKILAAISLLLVIFLIWFMAKTIDLGNSLEKFDEAGAEVATSTALDNASETTDETDVIHELTPQGIANSKTLTLDRVTFTIPQDWKAEDTSAVMSGANGFYLYSPDYQSKNEDAAIVGDINPVQKGIRFAVEYNQEEVDTSVEDSQDYYEAFVAGANNIPNWISQKSYRINEIPLLASRHGYQYYPEEKDEWLLIQGRKDGKNIRIRVEYATEFDKNQEIIETIISNFKF